MFIVLLLAAFRAGHCWNRAAIFQWSLTSRLQKSRREMCEVTPLRHPLCSNNDIFVDRKHCERAQKSRRVCVILRAIQLIYYLGCTTSARPALERTARRAAPARVRNGTIGKPQMDDPGAHLCQRRHKTVSGGHPCVATGRRPSQ